MKRKVVSFDLTNQLEKSLMDYVEVKHKNFSDYVKELIQTDMKKPVLKVELTSKQKAFIEFTRNLNGVGE